MEKSKSRIGRYVYFHDSVEKIKQKDKKQNQSKITKSNKFVILNWSKFIKVYFYNKYLMNMSCFMIFEWHKGYECIIYSVCILF